MCQRVVTGGTCVFYFGKFIRGANGDVTTGAYLVIMSQATVRPKETLIIVEVSLVSAPTMVTRVPPDTGPYEGHTSTESEGST